MSDYYRPLAQTDSARPEGALPLAGGMCWFDRVEVLSRTAPPRIIDAHEVPADVIERLSAPRTPIAGLSFGAPLLMGILNVTPDSFSDGGKHFSPQDALARACQMADEGADILDIGGESTRPGAQEVAVADEIARTAPVIAALRGALTTPISLDTRKAGVARAAGADIINDVSGFTFDPELAPFCAAEGLPVCVMHAQGDPMTMQQNPIYENVLLDVYDFLAAQVEMLVQAGVARNQIIVDPGIGFGKALEHNLALLNRISLFHALGCPILLGASRKKFIATIGGAVEPVARMPGSVAVALTAAAQGVQILRVHDVVETRQALNLAQAVNQEQI